jgi:hypothetical protein
MAERKAMLRERFGDGTRGCSRILDEMDRTQDLNFDPGMSAQAAR